MKLVKFTRDERPHHGYTDIFVNPEEVSSLQPLHDSDNRTRITLRNGTVHSVTDYVNIVAEKLEKAHS